MEGKEGRNMLLEAIVMFSSNVKTRVYDVRSPNLVHANAIYSRKSELYVCNGSCEMQKKNATTNGFYVDLPEKYVSIDKILLQRMRRSFCCCKRCF